MRSLLISLEEIFYRSEAKYKVFSSVLSATPLVVEPARALGYSAQLRVSSTFLFLISIKETLLSSPLATYIVLTFFERI